ncbi:MAG TPA: dTMP kinase [Candidatus Binatia bacterium]
MSVLITIDGVEGAGKSTQATRLADALRRDGHEVVVTREPGGTELGRALRRMLLEDDSPGPTPETELLLYLADRAEHVRRLIQPALERGALVIADRFSDSTIAYQSYGRGIPLETVRRLDAFARGGVSPALTFFLDLPPEEGLARARSVGPADRLERETLEFHRRVREGFLAIAAAEPERVVLLDARLDIAELAQRMAELARARLAAAA